MYAAPWATVQRLLQKKVLSEPNHIAGKDYRLGDDGEGPPQGPCRGCPLRISKHWLFSTQIPKKWVDIHYIQKVKLFQREVGETQRQSRGPSLIWGGLSEPGEVPSCFRYVATLSHLRCLEDRWR